MAFRARKVLGLSRNGQLLQEDFLRMRWFSPPPPLKNQLKFNIIWFYFCRVHTLFAPGLNIWERLHRQRVRLREKVQLVLLLEVVLYVFWYAYEYLFHSTENTIMGWSSDFGPSFEWVAGVSPFSSWSHTANFLIVEMEHIRECAEIDVTCLPRRVKWRDLFFGVDSGILGKKPECSRTQVEPTTFQLLIPMLYHWAIIK